MSQGRKVGRMMKNCTAGDETSTLTLKNILSLVSESKSKMQNHNYCRTPFVLFKVLQVHL